MTGNDELILVIGLIIGLLRIALVMSGYRLGELALESFQIISHAYAASLFTLTIIQTKFWQKVLLFILCGIELIALLETHM